MIRYLLDRNILSIYKDLGYEEKIPVKRSGNVYVDILEVNKDEHKGHVLLKIKAFYEDGTGEVGWVSLNSHSIRIVDTEDPCGIAVSLFDGRFNS